MVTGEIALEQADPSRFRDWEGLLAMLRAAFAPMDGMIDPPSSLHRLDAAGLAAKARAEALILAREDGTLAGCLFCRPEGDALHLGKIAVRPGLQRHGLGRRLVAEAERAARALGLPALVLQTRIELAGNHAAFAAMGFRRVGATAHPGHTRPTSVTMRKELA